MAFNAEWLLNRLAKELSKTVPNILSELRHDLADLINTCPVFRLKVSNSGNTFILLDQYDSQYRPPATAGLYSIFTSQAVIYFGEGTDLCRRQLVDPDNTADSTKSFSNQGRAILKLLLHKGWAGMLGLDPLYMQIYPGTCELSRQNQRTFNDCYKVGQYSKAIEGAMGLFVYGYHSLMIARAKKDGLLI